MSFDDAAVRTLLDEIVSHAASLGIFDRVASHEPKNAPGSGLSCSVWADAIDPLARASGLASTSGRVAFNVRIYSNMLAEPQDDIDREILTATSTLMGAYSSDFTLGGIARAIDLLGMYGTPLSAKAGYLNHDGKLYRIMEITLPVICNDMWSQTATGFPGGVPVTTGYVTELLPSGDTTGVTDTANIQALLNSAPPGGIVRLHNGIYYTIATLSRPPGVILAGAPGMGDSQAYGDSATIIKPVAAFTGTSVIAISAVGHALTQGGAIMGISIDGSLLAVTADGILGTGPVNGETLRDVFISSVTGWGINSANDSGFPYGWHAYHVKIHDPAGGGVRLLSHTDGVWNDVHVLGAGGENYAAASNGWSLNNCSNSHFTDCRAEWSGAVGLKITGAWTSGTGGGGCVITGFSTDRNNQSGVSVDATGTCPIIFNGLMLRRDGANGAQGAGAGGGAFAGIKIVGATVPVIINGVTCYPGIGQAGDANSPQYGMSVISSPSYVSVDNAYLQGDTAGLNNDGTAAVLKIGGNVGVASGTTAAPVTGTVSAKYSAGLALGGRLTGIAAAPVTVKPAAPAATASLTLVMMGLGATCAYTPSVSGVVLVAVTGYLQVATAVASLQVGCRYGTGTAPVNGAAVTGTRFGALGDPQLRPAAVGVPTAFAFTEVLSLVAGTAYWFDLALLTGNAADAASVTNISMTFAEQP